MVKRNSHKQHAERHETLFGRPHLEMQKTVQKSKELQEWLWDTRDYLPSFRIKSMEEPHTIANGLIHEIITKGNLRENKIEQLRRLIEHALIFKSNNIRASELKTDSYVFLLTLEKLVRTGKFEMQAPRKSGVFRNIAGFSKFFNVRNSEYYNRTTGKFDSGIVKEFLERKRKILTNRQIISRDGRKLSKEEKEKWVNKTMTVAQEAIKKLESVLKNLPEEFVNPFE